MSLEEKDKLLPEEEKMGEIVLYSDIFRERVFQIILVWVKGALRKILFLPQEVMQQEIEAKEQELEEVMIRASLDDLRKSFNAYAFLNFDERMRAVLSAAAASPLLQGPEKEPVEVLPGSGAFKRGKFKEPMNLKDLFDGVVKEYPGEDLRRLKTMVRHGVIDDEESEKVPAEIKPLFACIIAALRQALEDEMRIRERHSPLPKTGRQALQFITENPDFLEILSGIMSKMEHQTSAPEHWEDRTKGRGKKNPILPAVSPAERVLNQAYELLIPSQMTIEDLRHPDRRHCLWGRLSGARDQAQSILDFLERDKLSLLLEIKHDLILPLKKARSFLEWATLPEGIQGDEERIEVLLSRMLVGFKVFHHPEYYESPDPAAPDENEKISPDELWMMYYFIRDALESSESIEEALAIILPGVKPTFPEGKECHDTPQFPFDRFLLWSRNAGIYFEAMEEKNAMLLVESFFDALANKTKEEWERKNPEWKSNPKDPQDPGKSFFEVLRDHARKRATFERADLLEISREEEIKSRIRAPWKHLANRTIRDMLNNPDKVEEIAKVITPFIDLDRAIRIFAHQHLVKLDPRLLSDGKIMDTFEMADGDTFCTLAVISGQLAVVSFEENHRESLPGA